MKINGWKEEEINLARLCGSIIYGVDTFDSNIEWTNKSYGKTPENREVDIDTIAILIRIGYDRESDTLFLGAKPKAPVKEAGVAIPWETTTDGDATCQS